MSKETINNALAVHVGFPKTGTTTLQNHLFAKHSQIEYLGKQYRDDRFKEALFHLLMTDSVSYKPDEYPVETYIRERTKTVDASKKVMVLSEEIFLSYSKVHDKGQVATRLKERLAPGKIIITLRNQFSLIKSAYLGRGRLLMNVPPKYSGLSVTFEEWLEMSDNRIQGNFLELADYIPTVDFYSRLFGKENVLVLLLEELIDDKAHYLEKLSGFLEVDAAESMACFSDGHDNKAISRAELENERLRTRFFPFHRFPPVAGVIKLMSFIKKRRHKDDVARVEVPAAWASKLKDRYSSGNKRLVDEYGLALEKYGYPL